MALWSSYVDFLSWEALNLPGIKPFALSSVLGTQSFNLTMYLIDENRRDAEYHYRKDMTEVIKLELSNDKASSAGKNAARWLKEESTKIKQKPDITLSTSKTDAGLKNQFDTNESEVASTNIYHGATKVDSRARKTDLSLDHDYSVEISIENTIEEIEEIDDDIVTAAELGEGIYLRSGDSVIIKEFLSFDEKSSACSIINGGGFAVLARRDLPIIIEKTKKSKKNKLIKSGDTV